MSSDKSQDDAAQGLEPLACVACRARKLKCDRAKGACNRCVKVDTECVYPESRRKPTFKRRNVKELEARLAQVEDYLKDANKNGEDATAGHDPDMQLDDFDIGTGLPSHSSESHTQATSNHPGPPMETEMPSFEGPDDDFIFTGGELMGLGMSEALPPFEVMEELNNSFFQVMHHLIPVVHPGRYYQAFYGAAARKPPMCLQYAIWALGALLHGKYGQYSDIFYKRARQYADADEMKGYGEHFITIQHAQTWNVLASYEAKNMLFTKAAMSSARCVRLVNMMGLDRLDVPGQEVPPALGPATTWAELEERRRVFWGVFAIDSHASISTGWPSLIDSTSIMTRLPSSEEAFIQDQEEQSSFLEEVYGGASYAGFASTIVICEVFKTIMHHTHRSKPSDNPDDLMNGMFWTRHRELDNKLSGIFMFLPEKFRLPQYARDPAAVHTNLNLHASVICLHHAAIEMCDKHKHPESVKRTSVMRLKTSAEEIVNIIKMTSHQPSIFKSPLCALSMYCASTVYVYMAKTEATASQVTAIDLANLQLILQAMEAIGRTHDMTRSFLSQACMDIERNNLKIKIDIPNLGKYREVEIGVCPNIPLFARGHVAKHTAMSPVIPGRPKRTMGGRTTIALWHEQASADLEKIPTEGTRSHVRSLINSDCFQPMLGAVSRNVAVPGSPTVSRFKRKRTSPSPAPEPAPDFAMLDTPGVRKLPDMQKNYENMAPSLAAVGLWRAGGLSIRGSPSALPDRTNSSASSPANGLGTGTETQSGSSHTSPATAGLGNTAEDNHVDLRVFQDRISTPIWQSTEEVFLAHMSETMVSNALPADGSDPWGLLTGDLNWDVIPGATGEPLENYNK